MDFMDQSWLVWLVLLLCSLSSAELLDQERFRKINNSHFDFIILRGGTAGLVVASRFSEDPQVTVAVIEAGDFEKNSPNVTSTTALGAAKNTRVDWQYESVPQAFAGNQSLVWSAGKGLGGSSLINGMTHIRPASSQIDLWPSLGLELDWSKLFAFSRKGEHFQPPSSALTALGASYQPSAHGFRGPLTTCVSPHTISGDIHDIFNTTFKNLGIPPRLEFNGGELRGFGLQETTQDGLADVREDAARAYYYAVMNRRNLVVIVNTTATRILWSNDSPNENAVASAAEVSSENGDISFLNADREIILSAVGENLQDQITIAVSATTPQRNSSGFPPFVAHASLHDFFGFNTSSLYNTTWAKLPEYAAAIAARNGGASTTTTQQMLLQSQLNLLLSSNTPASEIAPIAFGNIIGAVFWPLQPFSRGSVHTNNTDKTAAPAIDARFFQFDFDGRIAVETARFVRRFLTTAPLSNIVNATSLNPSFEIVLEDANDDVWFDWIKTKSLFQPNYHHLGTCAMLPKAMGGVVDDDFTVYGTKNVRVVD